MKTILFADRNGTELQPLTDRTCVALLPIAAKPLIEYSIEALFRSDLHEVIIVISAYADEIERYLGNGERWGMQFEYVLSRGQEDPDLVLARLGMKLNDPEYLLVRADMLHTSNIKIFLRKAQTLKGQQVVATINGNHAGIGLLRRQIGSNPWQASHLLCFPLANPSVERENQVTVDGNLFLLDSLKAYHHTNLAVLAGNEPTLILPVRTINKKLQVGRCSDVPEHNEGLVGAFCRVHNQAALLGQVVLSNDVIVDRDAQLKATVVLPDTYIGPGIELHNAIVWGNLIIQIDNSEVVQITDNLLLTDFKKESISHQLAGKVNRSLGILTFLISLPLWPFAILAALLQNPRAPLHKIKLRGNLINKDKVGSEKYDFIALEWATSIPLLRHLPKLFAVISGQLRMVGVSPQTPEQAEARTEEWEKLRDTAPIGIIGPSQLTLPPNAPIEERLIVEGYYARTRHIGTDILWLLRGLYSCLTKRAWLESKAKL